jgi:2,4-dichlorophenol 6-monooxygenase
MQKHSLTIEETATDEYVNRLHSPELSSNLPLIRSEPIFRKIAEERNPGKVLFSHCVTGFEDNRELVLVSVQGPDGEVKQYRTQYLIGADGGRFVGPKIGIQMEGPRNLVDFVSTQFRADLSEHWDGTALGTFSLTD